MSYANAALLNDDPMTLSPRDTLTLRYRVIAHPKRWNTAQLRAAQKQFSQSATKNPSLTVD
jgi:hypothetical protein